MKLTIGMIVKNEERFIGKCLNAIKPILDNVDCELVIADSGSSDGTLEAAGQFTDNIIHFEWTNDFAAARNTVFAVARGEWFMVLDADDIFVSCDNIIDFFNSGEYKNYNAATYISRNLLDNEGHYTDLLASRMTKIFPDTRYIGRIHEYLSHYTHPIKNIPDIAIHYGYLFENKDAAKKKAYRNIDLLLEMLDEGENYTPLIFLQLAESYSMAGESEKAGEFIEKGLEYCRNCKSPYLATYFNYKAVGALQKNDFGSVLEICGEYFREKEGNVLSTDLEMYAVQAEVCFEHLNFNGAVDAFCRYFELYEDVKTGVINTDDASALNFRLAIDDNYIGQLCDFIKCCVICKNYDTVEKYLDLIPFEKHLNRENDFSLLLESILGVVPRIGNRLLRTFYDKLNQSHKDILIRYLIIKLWSADEKSEIIDCFRALGKDGEVNRARAGIYENYFMNNAVSAEQIAEFISQNGNASVYDILMIIMDTNIDISLLLENNGYDVKNDVHFCSRSLPGFNDIAENYSVEKISDINALEHLEKLYDYCISLRLIDNQEKTNEEKEALIKDLFNIKSQIKNRRSMLEFEQLSVEIKRNIENYIDVGDIEKAVKTLDEYVRINPNDAETEALYERIRSSSSSI